jgi:hypothetical protein
VEGVNAADKPTPYRTGMTALIVAVPEAEPVVGHWRSRYDHSAAAGVCSHVTVLFPFLDLDRIDTTVIGDLTQIVAAHREFTTAFHRTARWPSMLYLPPEPAAPFSDLTQDVTARWPDCLPYDGKHPDTSPHLTVAIRQPDLVLDQIEDELTNRLPFSTTVTSVDLAVFEERTWRLQHSFKLSR